jgi:hypothetical protein
LVLVTLLAIITLINIISILTVDVPGNGDSPVVVDQNPQGQDLSLTVIQPSDCEQCFDATQIVTALKDVIGLEFVQEQTLSQADAKTVLSEYTIDRLPAIIVEGAHPSLDQLPFFEKDGASYVMQSPAPYADLEGNVHGIVSLITLSDTDCEDCFDVTLLKDQLALNGMVFSGEEDVLLESDEGRKLIDTYNITRVPTVLLSSDASEYDFIASGWDQIGSIESDGMMILRDIPAPYHDLDTDTVLGLVELTAIVDESCDECFDISLLKQILLDNYGMVLAKETEVDISSSDGKDLREIYSISAVPTVILSEDALAYPVIRAVWSDSGTIEEDGVLVFRELSQLAGITYNDLDSNERVTT